MKEREALKLALEALEYKPIGATSSEKDLNDQAITAIKEALAQPPLTENGIYQLGYHNGYGFGEAYAKKQMSQPEQEPVTWRNAAIRVGEDLCSVGPFGYYDMTAEQWLDWALSVVTVHTPQPQSTWVGLTDEEMWGAYTGGSDIINLNYAKAIEAKLKEKNT